MITSPRCGKPMTRRETANGPQLEQPECGRSEGHNPPCRSAAALARQYRADVTRAARRRVRDAEIRALLTEVIAVLAGALAEEDTITVLANALTRDGKCDRCPGCLRAMSPGRVTCRRCCRDSRPAEWPVTREEAA